ncbi:hypothetical protein BCR44DRAFT_1434262 [Catenaria anguillulae PL171]|uniref:Uncharacterized protein n=1 Tax=Catenaria anguillulae PL171 TaxID=765915 RepID=A0A1Y2HLK5_9FUNG|nr:hypothetical protein BCR44DRAFT_1434262 [Catenaria anguillulae PL171]
MSTPSKPTPTATPTGIKWVADFSTQGDQVVLVFVLRKNKSLFWKSSMVGSLMLVPVPLFELGFTFSMWTAQTLWGWPPLTTLVGDVFVRGGYGIITVCRFWRLKLISPSRPSTALKYFRLMSGCILLVTLVNLYSAAALRITETVTGQFGVISSETTNKAVLAMRTQDKILGFITFMAVHLSNFMCDVLFAKTIFTSVRKSHQKVDLTPSERRGLVYPYVPPAVITLAYMFCSILSLTSPHIPNVIYFSIALNRLAPIIEAFCFYAFSVNHTRMLLKNLSRTGSNSQNTGLTGTTLSHSGGARSLPMLNFSDSQIGKGLANGYEPAMPMGPMSPKTPTSTQHPSGHMGANAVTPGGHHHHQQYHHGHQQQQQRGQGYRH